MSDQHTLSGELCTTCHDGPHPYAPFMSPVLDGSSGKMVRARVLPLRPYAVAADDLP